MERAGTMQEERESAAKHPSREDVAARLEEIAEEVRVCTKCELCKMRTKAVPGDGSVDAPILFIGEAPGFHEDQSGRPFVGAAGNLLNDLLASVGIQRSEVFITNLVKCRPPGNRDPLPDEVNTCTSNYLDRQIALINPRMIVAVGRFSMQRFFPGEKIMKIHGQPKRADGRIYFPMIHPAAALHQPAFMEHVKEDMKKIPALLEEAKAMAAPESDGEPPAQLTLF
jgi:uracil-DNA glycosylase family 4